MRHSTPRHTAPLLAAVLATLCLGAASASAQDDTVMTAKGAVRSVKVLGDTMVVVSDRRGNKPNRVERVIDGTVRGARGMTGSGIFLDAEQPGRMRGGRVVVPFRRASRITSDDRLVDERWFLYDVEKDTATRLRGLPGGDCTPRHVAVWGGRMAYAVEECRKLRGIHLRDGKGTKRISRLRSAEIDDPLVLRGRNLVMASTTLDGDMDLWRLMDGGEVCPTRLESSSSHDDDEHMVHGVWMTGRRVSWWMDESPAAGNLVLSTELTGDCSRPEAPGAFEATAEEPVALEGDDLYTASGRVLHRRDAGTASKQPPANDAVANARDISGALPITVGARVGYATRTADEPAVSGTTATGGTATATRTVWYAYRPAAAGSVTLTAQGGRADGGSLTDGAYAVYDDPGTGTLTELPKQPGVGGTSSVTFTANPSHRYLIGLGCDAPGACWTGFTLRLQAA